MRSHISLNTRQQSCGKTSNEMMNERREAFYIKKRRERALGLRGSVSGLLRALLALSHSHIFGEKICVSWRGE